MTLPYTQRPRSNSFNCSMPQSLPHEIPLDPSQGHFYAEKVRSAFRGSANNSSAMAAAQLQQEQSLKSMGISTPLLYKRRRSSFSPPSPTDEDMASLSSALPPSPVSTCVSPVMSFTKPASSFANMTIPATPQASFSEASNTKQQQDIVRRPISPQSSPPTSPIVSAAAPVTEPSLTQAAQQSSQNDAPVRTPRRRHTTPSMSQEEAEVQRHHFRRPSVAIKFSPLDDYDSTIMGMDMMQPRGPRRMLSFGGGPTQQQPDAYSTLASDQQGITKSPRPHDNRRVQRPPSPLGDCILKGDFSFD